MDYRYGWPLIGLFIHTDCSSLWLFNDRTACRHWLSLEWIVCLFFVACSSIRNQAESGCDRGLYYDCPMFSGSTYFGYVVDEWPNVGWMDRDGFQAVGACTPAFRFQSTTFPHKRQQARTHILACCILNAGFNTGLWVQRACLVWRFRFSEPVFLCFAWSDWNRCWGKDGLLWSVLCSSSSSWLLSFDLHLLSSTFLSAIFLFSISVFYLLSSIYS